jgi:hypothetical protein
MLIVQRIEEVEEHEVNPLSGQRVDRDARPLRRVRPLCSECQRRAAVTCVRGRHVVLEDHDLCRQCWRARMDARTAATRRARRVGPWNR